MIGQNSYERPSRTNRRVLEGSSALWAASTSPADRQSSAFGEDFTIVPIMVGSLSEQQQALYGSILAPYLEVGSGRENVGGGGSAISTRHADPHHRR